MAQTKLLLFGLVLILLTSFTTAVIEDNFNRADDNNIGIATNGNTWTDDTGWALTNKKLNDSDSGAGTAILQLNSNNPTQIDIQAYWSGTSSAFYQWWGDGGITNVAVYTGSNGGNFKYYNSGWFDMTTPFVLTSNTWYNISYRNINYVTDTYDIYIDNVLEKSGATFHANVGIDYLATDGRNTYQSLDCIVTDGTNVTSDCELPTTPSTPENKMIINIEDVRSGETNINATVLIQDYGTYNINAGTVTTNITLNATTNYNITIYDIYDSALTYFNKSKIEVALSNSTYQYNTTVNPYVKIKAYNIKDDSNIIDFNVTYDSTLYNSDSRGDIYLPSFNESISFSGIATNYLNKSFNINSYNNSNITLNPYMYVRAYDLLTTSIITFFIVNYDGNTYNSNATGYTLLPSFNETINFNTTATNYFTDSKTHNSYNNSNITLRPYTNITGKNLFTGVSVEDLNITYYDVASPLTIYEVNMSGTSGRLPLFNASYNVTLGGNSTIASSSKILTASPYLEEVNFTFYKYNSVNINIFNYDNQSLIDQLVTIQTISDLQAMTNTTSNGTIWLNFLSPNDYELRFVTNGFVNTSRFFTVLDDSTQNISIYLQNATQTELQTIIVKDTSGQAVEGAIVRVKREHINNQQVFQEVQEVETNSEGKTAIYVERDTTAYYTFSIFVDGVAKAIQPSGALSTTKTFFIPDIIETVEFVINLEDSEIEGSLLDQIGVTTTLTVTNDTATFYFIDARSTIEGGKLKVYGKYLTNSSVYELLSTQTATGFEGTLSYTFPVKNNTIYKIEGYYIKNGDYLDKTELKRFDASVLVDKSTGIILAVMVLLAVALITVTMGTIMSILFTFGSLIPLVMLNFLDIPIAVITSLLALAIILFVRLRKQ